MADSERSPLLSNNGRDEPDLFAHGSGHQQAGNIRVTDSLNASIDATTEPGSSLATASYNNNNKDPRQKQKMPNKQNQNDGNVSDRSRQSINEYDQRKIVAGTPETPHNECLVSLSSANEPPPVISCKVCDAMIDIKTKHEQHVVKCEICKEATPIRDAPKGQKYIRCPCNGLLICKDTAQRISCPRPKCRKIIVLDRSSLNTNTQTNQWNPADITPVPGMCRVNCGHCQETFLFNSLTNQLARCPHCEKKSSVGREFSCARGLLFLFVAFLFLAVAITVTVVTNPQVSQGQTGWIALYTLFYLLGIFFIMRSIYFLTMKTSIIEIHP